MPRKPKVVIIGAGIGGLTAAASLLRFGIDVEVYEQASQLGEVGAGLQIGPNAVRVIKALGLEERLLETASEPTNMVSLNWNDASLRFREPLRSIAEQEYGARYLTAHRADLHQLLLSLRSGLVDSFECGVCRCVFGRVGRDGVVCRRPPRSNATFWSAPTASIRPCAANCSATSRPDSPIRFAGATMVPMEIVPTRIGPGGSVTLQHGEYSGWIGPTGHVICYPIRGGKFLQHFCGPGVRISGSMNPG